MQRIPIKRERNYDKRERGPDGQEGAFGEAFLLLLVYGVCGGGALTMSIVIPCMASSRWKYLSTGMKVLALYPLISMAVLIVRFFLFVIW